MPVWDAIVIGLGGMGSAAVRHLAARGLRVLGFDALHPPHDRGSSHGATRVIRQAYFEHPAYVPLLLRAYELWRDLERATGESLLLLPGGLMMGAPDSEVVVGSRRSAGEHGLRHEMLDTADIRRRFPIFRIPDGTVALFEPEAGLVFCERAVAAHLRDAAIHGADLRCGEPVANWRSSGAGVEVTTGAGRYQAGALVVTPGPWAPSLLCDLNLPFQVERQVLWWFEPPGGVDAFLPSRFPVYIWQRDREVTPYGFPAVDGPHGGVKIAFYRSPHSEICTPESAERDVRAGEETEIREILRDFLPALNGPRRNATTCLYTLTPDLNFVVDQHPEHPNVVIAAGFSGHGFKFCSVMGEVLADLVSSGTSRFDLGLFGATRFRKEISPISGLSRRDRGQ